MPSLTEILILPFYKWSYRLAAMIIYADAWFIWLIRLLGL